MGLAEFLLPLVARAAEDLAGTPLADVAATDLKSVEAITARHKSALEAELQDFVRSRLYPAPAEPAA